MKIQPLQVSQTMQNLILELEFFGRIYTIELTSILSMPIREISATNLLTLSSFTVGFTAFFRFVSPTTIICKWHKNYGVTK